MNIIRSKSRQVTVPEFAESHQYGDGRGVAVAGPNSSVNAVDRRTMDLNKLEEDINRLEQEGKPYTVVPTAEGKVAVDLTRPPERELRIVDMLDQTMKDYADDVRNLREEIVRQFNKVAEESEQTVKDVAASLNEVTARANEVIGLCDLVSHDLEGAGKRIKETHSAFMVTSRNAMAALLNVKEAVAAQMGLARSDDEVARSEIESLLVKLGKIAPKAAFNKDLKAMLEKGEEQ